MRNNDRLHLSQVPDVGATAEVNAAAQGELARARLTGGPPEPCATPLPHGQVMHWQGLHICDAMAAEFVRGRYAAASDVDGLARDAARFGVAYVRERATALHTEAKRLAAAVEIREAAGS